MSSIHPFRAITYNLAKVGSLDSVVAQPYDKIDEALQEEYTRRHRYHIVRISKGKAFPSDTEEDNAHTRAGKTLEAWLAEGVLERDRQPCLYISIDRYRWPVSEAASGAVPERLRSRLGVVALLDLEPLGGQIRAHERTFPKPREDRLRLVRATRGLQEGHVFVLYSDPAFSVKEIVDKRLEEEPDLVARDDFGAEHHVWRVSDPEDNQKLQAVFQERILPRGLVIADGHHRYEVALEYAREMRAQGARCEGTETYDRRMVTLFNTEVEQGLSLFATHRLLKLDGIPGLDRVAKQTEKFFEARVYRFSGPEGEVHARQEWMEDLRIDGFARTAIGVAARGASEYLLLLWRQDVDPVRVVPGDLSFASKRLDVTILHELVLSQCLGLPDAELDRPGFLSYTRHPDEALERLARGDASIAFLLNPMRLEQIVEVTRAGELLPQKSTDFYPKLLTGLVMNRVVYGQ